MREEFTIERGGKSYVLFAGLLDEAHSQGLKSIDTDLLQAPTEENGSCAVVKATVEMEDGRTFTGIGDASPENVGRGIIPHLIRMAECVPLGSEILTTEGWKLYDEVEVGEEVFAYDVGRDELTRTPLVDARVFDAQPLVSVKGRSIDVMCTPNHKWAVKEKRGKRRLAETTSVKTSESILMAARDAGGVLELSDRDAAIIGWLATDGSLSWEYVSDQYGKWGPYPRAYIQQSKPEYVEEIRDLLGEDAGESVETAGRKGGKGAISTLNAHRFTLRPPYLRVLLAKTGLERWSDMPRLACNLSAPARAAMFDAMLKGDGTKNAYGRWTFGKGRKPGVMEALEILATLEGIALGKPRLSSDKSIPVRSLRKNRTLNSNHYAVVYEGAAKVWCPTTAFGTWVMKQNGYITITGNTRSKARALRDAVNVGAAVLEELSEGDDNYSSGSAQSRQKGELRAVKESGEDGSKGERQVQKATENQVSYLRALAEKLRGENGVERLEKSLGHPLEELSRDRAQEWIDDLENRER